MATAQTSVSAANTAETLQSGLREQLNARRHRLQHIAERSTNDQIQRLIDEVDGALLRLEQGQLGICESCHDFVEPEALMADPLARFCLTHLPAKQQRELEADLELAAELQARLLPDKGFEAEGWKIAYDYRPAGLVSGDYVDLIRCPIRKTLYFALGDVSGKGVAASMLMSNLNAMFRSLLPLDLYTLPELMTHANRIFCQSTLPSQYATLVLGQATLDGEVEICNAGHPEPLVARHGVVESIDGASAPIGLFRDQTFSSSKFQLAPGDALVLYSDGISEARNRQEEEFGASRLGEGLLKCLDRTPAEAIADCVRDLIAFRSGAPQADDHALLLIQRG
jgi:sigma-B regulation protein RsbU (phosphoserine phosphatase)